jgi:hypothetical protein
MLVIAVIVIVLSIIARFVILQQTAFSVMKDSIFLLDRAFPARVKLMVVLFVIRVLFALFALRDISCQVELVKYVVLVKAVDCVLDWEHALHAIADILFLEVGVYCAPLSCRIASFVVILLFACNVLGDTISKMEFV